MRTTLAALCLAAAAVQGADRAPANDTIRKEALKADLYFLASDDLQGRLTNTAGNRIAADWIASRFERMGLSPGGADGSYFQPFTLMTETLGALERNTLAIRSGDGARDLKYGATLSASLQRVSAARSCSGYCIVARAKPRRLSRRRRAREVPVLITSPAARSGEPFDGVVAGFRRRSAGAQFAQDKGAAGSVRRTSTIAGRHQVAGSEGCAGACQVSRRGPLRSRSARTWPAARRAVSTGSRWRRTSGLHSAAQFLRPWPTSCCGHGKRSTIGSAADAPAASRGSAGVGRSPRQSNATRPDAPSWFLPRIRSPPERAVIVRTTITTVPTARIFNGADDDGSARLVSSRSPRHTRRRRRTASGRGGASSSRRGTPKSADSSAPGSTPRRQPARSSRSWVCSTWT